MSETPATYPARPGAPAQPAAPARRVSGQNLSERGRRQAQRRFLDELETTANVAGACRAARISRTIAYEWKAQDPAFAAAWQDALDAALDQLEQTAIERAHSGSDQLLMFLLKAHRPEKYREVVNHEASGEVVVSVVFTNDWRGAGGKHTREDEGATISSSDTSSSSSSDTLDLAERVGRILGRSVERAGDADGVNITYRAAHSGR